VLAVAVHEQDVGAGCRPDAAFDGGSVADVVGVVDQPDSVILLDEISSRCDPASHR
jgi:hypothetical protein